MIAQRINALLRIVFVVIAGTALSGCIVTTKTWLSERADAKADDRLLGVWHVPVENEKFNLVFISKSKEGGMEMLTLELNERRGDDPQTADWDTAVLWPTRIAGRDYLNVEIDGGQHIVAYNVTAADTFEFGLMNLKLFHAAVKAGRLKGELKSSLGGTSVTLTDSAENITAFIRDNGGHDLFTFGEDGERMSLKRYKLAK